MDVLVFVARELSFVLAWFGIDFEHTSLQLGSILLRVAALGGWVGLFGQSLGEYRGQECDQKLQARFADWIIVRA